MSNFFDATGGRPAREVPPAIRQRARRALWPLALAALTSMLAACGGGGDAGTDTPDAARESAAAAKAAVTAPDFGPNVKIFDPGTPLAEIQSTVNAIRDQQVDNEMGPQRFAVLFKPGAYGTTDTPLLMQVGYYTEVAGLGASPLDVTVNGHIDVYNRCFSTGDCNALNNFWRSLANLSINVVGTGLDGCRASANFWAVSQAAPMRRVNMAGNMSLMDYCSPFSNFASGGYIADTQTTTVTNGSQQQFLVRDSAIVGWSNGVWNQVFSGVVGAPAQSFGGGPGTNPYTTLPTTAVSREKPYLYVDAQGAWRVFVPALRRDTSGTSWAAGATPGTSIGLERFYIAKPGDSAKTINRELDRGRHLLFTPGIYHLDRTLKVKRAGTVVLGLGYPTLVPDAGVVAMTVADAPGVRLAGLLFDAGPVSSPVLLRVGKARDGHDDDDDEGDDHARRADAGNPTSLHDVFFRIGGAGVGKADTSLVVYSDHVLLDHIWAWRADHGVAGSVGWDVNTADTGVVVNGDGVSAYGLFVEHYQKTQVVWNGEGGRTVFFQNEMPYDPPNQAAWRDGTKLGYAAYQVAPGVKTHEAWGLGSYCFFNVDPSIHASRGFEAPVTPGVSLHSLLTVSLGGVGTIDHVINEIGAAAQGQATVPVTLIEFP